MNRSLIYVSIFTLLVVYGAAAPVGGTTVDNPCKIDPRGQPEFPPLHEWLLSTLSAIGEAQATFQAASRAVVKAGLIESELQMLKPLRLPSLPVREDAPADANASSMVEVLRRDFSNIAVHVLFLQAFQADQLSQDYGRLVSDIGCAERSFIVLLCKCDLFMMSHNVTDKTPVDASFVPLALTQLSDAKARLARNYLLMTQSSDYITSMASYIQRLLELNNILSN